MATIRLIPSTYAVSSTSYLSVSNASNMYTNVDSNTYATITNTYASTSSRYLYLRGFNFDDIPSGAEINSFTIKIKGYESGLATSTSYAPRLANGTSTISNTTASSNFGTSTTTITIPTGALTWQQIANYGSDFTIMVYVRRNSRNTTGYFYCYGAEIDVTYTMPDPRTITSTLSGNGTISPSGAQTYYDGNEYELTITPTNISDTVTVTNNNVDVTDQLEEHHSGGTSTSYSTASGSGVTTGFARSGGAFYQSSSTSSDSWLRYAIGHTAESPYSTSNTNNTYCKDGTNDATTQGWMNYPFSFSSLPNDAEVTAVEVKCYGATESTSETARHADVSLWCGSTQKGTTQQFTSTSNTTMTISDPGDWTREELQDAWVRFGVGYYGGRILGITWKVTYTYGGTLHHYTYSYEVNGDATIAVTIGSPTPGTQKIYVKIGSSETLVTSCYTRDLDLNSLVLRDLSSFNNGDICHIVGKVGAEQSGVLAKTVNIDDTFVWSSTNSYTATSGTNSYTLEFISTGLKITNSSNSGPYIIGQSSNNPFMIYKSSSGSWTQYSKVYKKVNGSWVEQASSTWATLFNTNTNYRKME